MAKEVLMTVSVDSDLWHAFHEAAESENVPAAQILCAFMREYVHRVRANAFGERQAREDAVRFAAASVALQGLRLYPVDEELGRRYIAGEITINEASESIHVDLGKL